MRDLKVVFAKERTTKNTVRYHELGGEQAVGTIYVRKAVLGTPVPEKLVVTISEAVS